MNPILSFPWLDPHSLSVPRISAGRTNDSGCTTCPQQMERDTANSARASCVSQLIDNGFIMATRSISEPGRPRQAREERGASDKGDRERLDDGPRRSGARGLTLARYPSSGTTTPASPWIGSTMKATILGSLDSLASSAPTSLYGIYGTGRGTGHRGEAHVRQHVYR